MSFLGVGQEETKPPDKNEKSDDPGGGSSVAKEASTPLPVFARDDASLFRDASATSPLTTPTGEKRRHSILSNNPTRSSVSQSPTAVPLIFRRPLSGVVAKSTPPSPATAFHPRPRSRPQSTEFKSNEFRPLLLLERHKFQNASDESSSRRASRDNDLEGYTFEEALAHGPSHSADVESAFPPDLVDSTQSTPTLAEFLERRAKQFPDPSMLVREPSPEAVLMHEHAALAERPDFDDHNNRAVGGVLAGLMIGGAAGETLNALRGGKHATEYEEDNRVGTSRLHQEPPLVVEKAVQESSSDRVADVASNKMSKKDKVKERRARKDSKATGSSKNVALPTTDEIQAFREKDTQDAVDALFGLPSPTLSRQGRRSSKDGGRKRDVSEPEVESSASLNPVQGAQSNQLQRFSPDAAQRHQDRSSTFTDDPDTWTQGTPAADLASFAVASGAATGTDRAPQDARSTSDLADHDDVWADSYTRPALNHGNSREVSSSSLTPAKVPLPDDDDELLGTTIPASQIPPPEEEGEHFGTTRRASQVPLPLEDNDAFELADGTLQAASFASSSSAPSSEQAHVQMQSANEQREIQAVTFPGEIGETLPAVSQSNEAAMDGSERPGQKDFDDGYFASIPTKKGKKGKKNRSSLPASLLPIITTSAEEESSTREPEYGSLPQDEVSLVPSRTRRRVKSQRSKSGTVKLLRVLRGISPKMQCFRKLTRYLPHSRSRTTMT